MTYLISCPYMTRVISHVISDRLISCLSDLQALQARKVYHLWVYYMTYMSCNMTYYMTHVISHTLISCLHEAVPGCRENSWKSRVKVCCSVLQCVLQCAAVRVAVCCSACCSVLQWRRNVCMSGVKACCSVLGVCAAVCCGVLQCVAVRRNCLDVW